VPVLMATGVCGQTPAPAGKADRPAAEIEAPAAPAAEAPSVPAAPAVTTTIERAVSQGTNAIVLVSEEAGSKGLTSGTATNLLSISLDKVPLAEVVRMFTRISGANIVVGTNGHEMVSVSMQNVEWEPALRAILDSAGKVLLQKSPGIYTIGSKADVADEPLSVDTIFLKFITPTALVPALEKMLVGSNTSVVAISSCNALMIKGQAANISEIRKVILQVDVPREQVFIEAKFVELNDQAIKDLGINWTSLQGVTFSSTGMVANLSRKRDTLTGRTANQAQVDQRVHADGVNTFYDINNQPGVAGGPATFSGTPLISSGSSSGGSSGGSSGSSGSQVQVTPANVRIDGSTGRVIQDTIQRSQATTLGILDSTSVAGSEMLSAVLSASDFALTLSALKQNTGASVVSNPRLLVASGQSASIHVGEDRPFPKKSTSQQGTGGASTQSEIDTIKTGVELPVTPTINSQSSISLRIQPTLSRVTGTALIDGNEIPIVNTRPVQSEFSIENGRTVAIGGLTSDSDTEKVNKIPFLGDIPIIGKYLFSHTHSEKVQDEVIIFVSVSIAKAEAIKDNEGIPSRGKLIYQQMLKEQAADEIARRQRIADEQQQKQEQEVARKRAEALKPVRR
ncbi:MAG: hypothetical protein NTV49_14200, partial [Kiritimatiellaeota bacterium]|nr:hypothetical protein [Kiritimatiellota bacterium]